MGVIQKPTVLVLGAGASFDYGYPLGRGLVGDVLKLSDDDKALVRRVSGRGNVFDEFLLELRRADPSSVDEFLEQHPRFWDAGKAAMATVLLAAEQRSLGYGGLLKTPSPDLHWYQYLVRVLTAGVSRDDFLRHRLSIITFNYDRSLKQYLYQTLSAKYGTGVSPALIKALRITHVHGDLGALLWDGTSDRALDFGSEVNPHNVRVAMGRIQIVCDDVREGPFSIAHNLLGEAEVVCFLGFGYLESNLLRLKIDSFKHSQLFGTRLGIGRAEWGSITRGGHRPIKPTDQDFGRGWSLPHVDKLGIVDFLKDQPVLHWPTGAA